MAYCNPMGFYVLVDDELSCPVEVWLSGRLWNALQAIRTKYA